MSLKALGVIAIPGAAGSEFDHGIFESHTRRVFIAHTGRSTMEVIDPDGETVAVGVAVAVSTGVAVGVRAAEIVGVWVGDCRTVKWRV